jgi:hypothetical protein
MGFSFANLTRWLPIAGVALAVTGSAQAQPAGGRPGEAILFSPAFDDDISSNLPSLAAKPPGLMDFANAIPSPVGTFGDAPETEPLSAPPPPAVSPAQVQQMQRLLDERKNWALLTPEEIFGLPAPEKITGHPDRDAFGRPKSGTVVMQYYERQEQLRVRTNDYSFGAEALAARGDFSDGQEPPMNSNIWAPVGSRPENPALINQLLNGTPDGRTAPAQTPESGWSRSFNLPAPPPVATPEQQAAMEQFQELLQPHSPPGGGAKAPALGRPIFSASSTATAPESAAVIPMGASFTPLSSGIAAPAGVAPLPGILGPTNALPAFAPEWKPQAPPWASSAPQPGAVPQRKF